MSLEIPSKDPAYHWVMQWLVARGVHSSKHLGVETTYLKDASGHHTAFFDFVPSPGRHWVRYKGMFMRVDREREAKALNLAEGAPWETLMFTTLAWRPSLFNELLHEAKKMALNREEGKTIIYQSYGHEWRPFGNPKRIRPFDSVILDGEVAEKVLGDVKDFLLNHRWYMERGIPYRRGYLLHGPPGCGKSSYVMALAGALEYNITILNLGDPSMTDDRLLHLLAVVPPRCLVLLEDVDMAVAKRADANSSDTGAHAGVTPISFSGLLNALDGVAATEERIIFMTTNNYEELPEVLIRPGRVDLKIYIGLATKSQARRMYLKFFPGKDYLAERFASECDKYHMSMAGLQGFLMFFKTDPYPPIEKVGSFFEAFKKEE